MLNQPIMHGVDVKVVWFIHFVQQVKDLLVCTRLVILAKRKPDILGETSKFSIVVITEFIYPRLVIECFPEFTSWRGPPVQVRFLHPCPLIVVLPFSSDLSQCSHVFMSFRLTFEPVRVFDRR